MKSPIIIDGEPFPWSKQNPHGEVVDDSGEINWAAAFAADPGCFQCSNDICQEWMWNEGYRVKCPTCGTEQDTLNRRRA